MDRSIRKDILVEFVFFCLFDIFLLAGSQEELFLRANKYYEQRDFDKALTTYQSIENKGRAVWHNMGNCCYHLADYPQTLVCWKRACNGATYDECCALTDNEALLAQTLGKSTRHSWWYNWYRFIANRVAGFSLFVLQLLFLFVWYLLFFLMRKQRKKIIVKSIFALSLLMGLCVGVKYREMSASIAIVQHENVPVFAGPDKDYHVLANLDVTDQVIVQEERPGWYKIRYQSGIGWVVAEAIQVV